MKTSTQIKEDLHFRLLNLRNLDYFVATEPFQRAYDNATDAQKAVAQQYIEKVDLPALTTWVDQQIHVSKDLELYSLRELRKEAQRLGVSGYNYLTKGTLLSAIKQKLEKIKHEKERASRSNPTSSNGDEAPECAGEDLGKEARLPFERPGAGPLSGLAKAA